MFTATSGMAKQECKYLTLGQACSTFHAAQAASVKFAGNMKFNTHNEYYTYNYLYKIY
jgi:hypothetical protein